MTTSAKAIGAAASSLILLGSAALAAAPAVMDITADASPAAATQQATEASAAAEATGVQRVEGDLPGFQQAVEDVVGTRRDPQGEVGERGFQLLLSLIHI